MQKANRIQQLVSFCENNRQGPVVQICFVKNHIGQWVQEELAFKANYSQFSIFSSGGHFVQRSKTILAFLVEGRLSNIPMKFK